MVSHRGRRKRRLKRRRRSHKRARNSRARNRVARNPCSRLHEHPYRTRSKTLREVERTTDRTESHVPSRRSTSDSSVVYLGSFRKSPQLITLEDESCSEISERVVQPRTWTSVKSESVTSFPKCRRYVDLEADPEDV
ncbi:uncharacterized protein LOC112590708 [Harpegnathos saltator]|uniref:uncharacterized protein LOC112590708 n=1 Tax=Harpegnathos saltator TaxID=610380 RepID=UPI000DBED830|nr:uncharacterized protein LOC112590708 [Harpegnathos saltator]